MGKGNTCPVSLSNLYIRKPGLLAPSVVLFGVIEGARRAHDTGRPEKLTNLRVSSTQISLYGKE